MSDRGLTKPNWNEARRHIAALTCDADAVVCFQVFNDQGDTALGQHRHGRLSDSAIQKWLIAKIKAGCGVYIVINRTDGSGRRRKNIIGYLASFIDLDGAPLPTTWHLPPDLIIESSAGRYHAYWLLEPGGSLDTWEDTQKRLAAFYGSDPKVCDVSRVLRLAGFDHQKKRPAFRTRILEQRDNFGDRYQLDQVRGDLPAAPGGTSTAAKATSSTSTADIEWDTEAAVASAKSYLANVEPHEDGNRNNATYEHACKLNDIGISPKLAEEMLLNWNEAQDDPLPDKEIKHVLKSAQKYKQNAPAATALPFDVEDDAELVAEDFDDGSEPKPATKKRNRDKIPLMRLNDVDDHSIGRLFRFVNLNGRPRILYWGPSALDPKVRVPQFWTVPEFKQQLCNKVAVRVTQKTDPDGETVTVKTKYNITDAWLKSPKRRIYDGVVLVREQHSDHPDTINLWRGYGFEPKPGDWTLMREHIRKVIAKGIPERDEYIIRWLAWALQHPDLPCEVALICNPRRMALARVHCCAHCASCSVLMECRYRKPAYSLAVLMRT